ncbi:MAG TPA: deoxyguanosinetriphosphate triphosphohydrolase, partial [Gemmataceae bacterium]|nr:deoxyguanosinetriphosphate triphosphohydrolase [Gemmataceae bacterium]
MTQPWQPFEPRDWQELEEQVLAPYAMRGRASRGRRHQDEQHPFRSPYQRDRDRIVHSTAFRRLMYKTQVLVQQFDDHHRTRLTHTLEVAQISRTIARRLGLNEDLTEAIALAHDLGHPPFGHAGEEELNDCMANFGGFEHNLHGLRIIDLLEYRYANFPGLNLSWEVLEAQAWHSKRRQAPEIQPFLEAGQPLLEAQVVDAADSLAYDTHDIDDALSVGLITPGDLREVEFWRRTEESVRKRFVHLGERQFQPTMVRALIDWQVTDLLANTSARLRAEQIRTVGDVRRCERLLVEPSQGVQELKGQLEAFLHSRVYRNSRVVRLAVRGRRMLRQLFEEFSHCPELLPERYLVYVEERGLERTICDYLAGMTDRYAQDEYLKLFQP